MESVAEPVVNRNPDGTLGPGNNNNPAGKKGKGPPAHLKKKRGETQLDAMRAVVEDREDRSILQWEMRRWKQRDPDAFLAAKLALEKVQPEKASTTSGKESATKSSSALPGGGSAAEAALPTATDGGTGRCLELLDALLERLEREEGER